MRKIVFESLNEVISFERGKDPLSTLGIGKTQLIKNWLDEMKISHYIINDNLTIDVKKWVDLFGKNLIEFPNYIQFNKIFYGFRCFDNKLISLKGCPNICLGDFNCSHNQLTSLEGCPKIVYGSFSCSYNKLTSLQYCPKEINYLFLCQNNLIKFSIKEVLKYCNVKYKSNIKT